MQNISYNFIFHMNSILKRLSMKNIILICFMVIAYNLFADSNESIPVVVNQNAGYITTGNYLQNPYMGLTSKGGTQTISESQFVSQSFAGHVFADGTWNVGVGAAGQYTGTGSGSGGYPSFGYSANLFGQTGSVAGFSIGGLFTATNPFYDEAINGNVSGQNQHGANFNFLPANKQVSLSQSFLEYQYNNIVQVDAGYIGITNSPWLSMNNYTNLLTAGATYQGALINVYPGDGWLLTALAFNGAQLVGNSGFTPGTLYNTGVDYSGGMIVNTTNELSNGTMALGASYVGWNNQYNLRLWGYQFQNYGTLLYADNSIKFQTSKTVSFSLAAQAGSDNQIGNGNNAITNDNLGQISSNFVGLQGSVTLDFFNLDVGFNNVWGPSSAYGNGAIVSPYTYGFASDPLYTTPYMSGLADLSTAGQAYKISPTFNLLGGNLVISPAWTTFVTPTPNWNGANEYDFVVMYSIPEVKGLRLYAVNAYQQVPTTNSIGDTNLTQLFVTYLY